MAVLAVAVVLVTAPFGLSDALGLKMMQLPARPHASLSTRDVVTTLCFSLQHNHVPQPDAGLRRLWEFCTFEAKSALTARRGARTMERFMKYATSPAFAKLVNARSFEILEETLIAGTPTRGDMASIIVAVDDWESDGVADEYGEHEDARRFRWLLQQERRPPLEGCWLVREVISLDEQYLFNGDTGSTTTE